MIVGCKDNKVRLQQSAHHPRKENIPVSSPTNSRTVTFSTLHPNQPYSRILQSQFLNATQPPRMISPKEQSHFGQQRPRMIELGGSKQKRMTREKATSNCIEAKVSNNSNDNLNRKITVLENRVKELHMQKQYLAVQLNHRIRELEQQNTKLIVLIKESDQRGSELKDKASVSIDGNTEADRTDEEFNLEEEMSNQINFNLELREQIDKLNTELEQFKNREEQQRMEINNLDDQKSELKLQFLQLQDRSCDEIQGLKDTIACLEESLAKKDQNTTMIVEEKEKRILELEQEHYSLSHKSEENQKCQQVIQEELSCIKESHSATKEENNTLRARVQELERPVDCKKCKDLLHTVFRLNTQLNRR